MLLCLLVHRQTRSTPGLEFHYFFGMKLGALGSLGKITKRHQGHLLVKNALKIERTGNGIGCTGEIQALVYKCYLSPYLHPDRGVEDVIAI